MARSGIPWCPLVLALLLAAPARSVADTPEEAAARPITEAERRAVELVAAYLAEGPAAWWSALSSDSPLRALGRDAALAEIAVRAGPPEESRWVLQTPGPGAPPGRAVLSVEHASGVEEVLVLSLVEEEGGWRIRALRGLADPAPADDAFWRSGAREAPSGEAAPPPGGGAAAIVVLLLGALAAVAAAALPGRRRPALRLAALLAGVALTALAAACGRPREDGPSPPPVAAGDRVPGQEPARLGTLRDLRWAIAGGASFQTIEALAEEAPSSDLERQVTALWRSETQLWKVDLRAAEELLDALPASSGLPLEDLLRARLAAAQGEVEAAEDHYERARTRGIDHDGLRLELARTLATLGDSIGAGVVFTQLAEMGSRLAEAHYARARLWVLEGEPERGEPYLELGWRLEPMPREDLFADPLLSVLCARPSLFPTFSFGSPEEPLVESLDRGLRPVRLPRPVSAGLSGELLRIEVGGAELYVPGGGELAPGEALAETAADRLRRQEERILTRLPELVEEARTPAILTRPGRTRQLVEASFALARRNRWQEIVELTEGVAQVVGQAPGPVTQLRAAALHRTERTAEARDLLVRLAQSSAANRRRDPGTFYLLAELLVATQDYDRALQMMSKAASMSPMARNEHRVRQVSMEQRLYQDPETFETEHFDIVYPRTTSVEHAAELAGVLEAEVERLERWIPASPGTIHTVHLYPLIEFLEAYSENVLVLGIYDGRLRVPLADLRSLHPRLVAVLSHELAHAMVAAATDDQAPKWFQEGIAQHVEMVTGRLNPIPDLHREGRILAFPMIEGILDGFSEPQLVDLAYGEAAWVVHYVEAEHGVGAIRELIGAFARGRTTEEALREVFRMSVAEFDRAVWDWCLREAPAAWEAPARRRYEEEYSRYLRPSDRAVPGLPTPDAAVASWHAVYSARTRQVKALLGRIVGPIRNGGEPPRETCAVVVSGLAGVLEDPEVLAAPEAGLRRELEAAYRSLGQAAWHCREGEAEEARVALAQAELALGRAAQKLAPYGLQP